MQKIIHTSFVIAMNLAVTPVHHGNALAIVTVELSVITGIEIEMDFHCLVLITGIIVNCPYQFSNRIIRIIYGCIGSIVIVNA